MADETSDTPFLKVRTDQRSSHLLVAPEGELDASTCPALGEVLRTAVRDHEGDVVLDLDGIAFMDSSGLGVLLNAHRRLTRAGRTLHLAVPQDTMVRRLLRQTDLESTFRVHGSRRDAERAVA